MRAIKRVAPGVPACRAANPALKAQGAPAEVGRALHRRAAPGTNVTALTVECPGTMASVLSEYVAADSIRGVHPFLINWLQGCLGVR